MNTNEVVTIVLKKGGQLKIQVTEKETGKLLEGAKLKISSPEQASLRRTDPNGLSEVEGLYPGMNEVYVTHDNFTYACTSIVVENERALDVKITMSKGKNITGKISDDKGTPIMGVRVLAFPFEDNPWEVARKAVSDEEGKYVLENLPENRTAFIEFKHSDYERHEKINAKGGDHLDVTMKPVKNFEFLMIPEDGKAINRVEKIIYRKGRMKNNVANYTHFAVFQNVKSSHHDFRYEIGDEGLFLYVKNQRVFDTNVFCRFDVPGYEHDPIYLHELSTEKPTRIMLRRLRCVTGRVVHAVSRQPVMNSHVILDSVSQYSLGSERFNDESFILYGPPHAVTTYEGRFKLFLPSDWKEYDRLLVHERGKGTAVFTNFVEILEHKSPEFVFPQMGRIEGIFLDNGMPQVGVKIRLSYALSLKGRRWLNQDAITDVQGRYSFNHVFPGEAKISLVKTVSVSPGKTRSETIALQECNVVAGETSHLKYNGGEDVPIEHPKRYLWKDILKYSADYFFERLGKTPDELKKSGAYHYYAAMWALGKKCEMSPEERKRILEKAISMFNGQYDTKTKIQCLGVMAEAENSKHSTETYALMLNALQKHDNKQIRSFAAYSLLWYKDQSDVVFQLEKALEVEPLESVKNAIRASIERIKEYDSNIVE